MHTWREAVLGCAQPPADDGNLALEYYLVEQQIGEDKTWHALKVASDSPAALGQARPNRRRRLAVWSRSHPLVLPLQMIELTRPELRPELSSPLSDTKVGSDVLLSQRSSPSQAEDMESKMAKGQVDATVECTSATLEATPGTCYRFRVRTANPAGKSR